MASSFMKGARFCSSDKVCFLCANSKSAKHCLLNFSSLPRLVNVIGSATPKFIGNYFRPVSDHLLRVPIISKHSESYMLQWQRYKSDFLKIAIPASWSNQFFGNHDLKRFLEEVGTDPKEARYWLKQFQRLSSIPSRPFAVVRVDQQIFKNPEQLQSLSSNLAFLHRNDMKIMVIHGAELPRDASLTEEESQALRSQVTTETMTMVNFLEASGAPAHPLFSGSNVLKAEMEQNTQLGKVIHVNTEPLKWCIEGGHIPVISSIGETSHSQLVTINATHATEEIARAMQPIKILLLNEYGGLRDGSNRVIEKVHVPADVDTILSQPWCSDETRDQLLSICSLLNDLPAHSSFVIASANCILTELFTHHGVGTLFKNTERIYKFRNLDEVDKDRLLRLITKAFKKSLDPEYLQDISPRIHTIYLSECYNAVAIITKEEGVNGIPYLDKFAVSSSTQGEGTSDVVWEQIQTDFPTLFWRSQNANNKINSWYFKRCEGSWSNHKWTVFWYGISNPKESYEVVDWAVNHRSWFSEPIDPAEDLQASEPW